jgi:hypothetical protein
MVSRRLSTYSVRWWSFATALTILDIVFTVACKTLRYGGRQFLQLAVVCMKERTGRRTESLYTFHRAINELLLCSACNAGDAVAMQIQRRRNAGVFRFCRLVRIDLMQNVA